MDPRTTSWVNSELNLMRKSSINKIITGAGDSNSVGQAQLINSMIKHEKETASKEGPAFIFTHVPLNENQEQSEVAQIIDQVYQEGGNLEPQ